MSKTKLLMVLATVLAAAVATAQTPLIPQADDEVVEILPSGSVLRPTRAAKTGGLANSQEAANRAQEAIGMARKTGDNRFWGRAESILAPWWDRIDAPVELAVLQATVQQGRHEFLAAQKVLEAALVRQPGNAQAWLNLAALERLLGNYSRSQAACLRVAQSGQAFYAQACALETRSLLGQNLQVTQELTRLLGKVNSPDQRSWLLSLLAENQERAGQVGISDETYQRSLAQQRDLYTAIAYADLLLRNDKPAQAIRVLTDYPATDAVLLRRAFSLRRLGDSGWLAHRTELRQRIADLKRRGDDIELHGRELALGALWLDDDPQRALVLAKRNLKLQREPVDWLVARTAAMASNDNKAVSEFEAEIRKSGLVDARLYGSQGLKRSIASPGVGS